METKERVIDNINLENIVEVESKDVKKSYIKFMHVFESDAEKMYTISRRKNVSSIYNKDTSMKIRNIKATYYYLISPQVFSFFK